MEGSCDPTKLVSQFLLRKTLVQVRRRILQCCRPGSPDNIVKAFRYQRVLWPMTVACRRVEPGEQRPPVEREEELLPLWLLRSLPVIYPTIRDYNSLSGSVQEAPPPCRSGGARQSHMILRRSASHTYSFTPGTRYPPRLPKHLDLRRIGFVLLQKPLPPPPTDPSPLPDRQVDCPLPDGQVDSSPLPDGQVDSSPLHLSSSPLPDGQVDSSPLHLSSSPLPDRQVESSPLPDGQVDSSPLPDGQVDCPGALSRPRVLLRRLLLSRTDTPADTITTPAVSMTTRERIRCHYQTLTSLRKRRRKRRSSASPPEEEKPAQNKGGARWSDEETVTPPPPEGPAPSQVEVQEGDDVIRTNEEEEEEEESEVLLALSESSPSSTGSVTLHEDLADPEEAESESEVTLTPSRAAAAGEDDDDEGETSSDESVLQLQEESSEDDEDDQRECEDAAFAQDYLLRVCDAVQASPGVSEQLLQVLDQSSVAEVLYDGLRRVLRPWPQLLRDFAAFLTRGQARRCGLLMEQQLFERSRRFLQRLRRSLGEGSSPYQQVVSVLQGSSAPPPEHMDQISSLLRRHSDLQEEFWEFFRQLHGQSSPVETGSESTEIDYASQNPSEGNRKRAEACGESERPVCAKNISMSSSGEKVVVWTREADRAILTACQQRGANQKTFRQVSAQLGNKTAQQVSLRFHDLMNLFHSAFQKGRPISRQEAALTERGANQRQVCK